MSGAKGKIRAKAKCGGLSTTAASAPPPVEMTISFAGGCDECGN
jgi:hypothetical protein